MFRTLFDSEYSEKKEIEWRRRKTCDIRGHRGQGNSGIMTEFRKDRTKYPNHRVSNTEITKQTNLKGACYDGRLCGVGNLWWGELGDGLWEYW